MLHNLATTAALLGRRPLLPAVPCAFLRAVQPGRQERERAARSRLGLLLPSVVPTGPAAAPSCHLAPAEYKEYQALQCWPSYAMAAFDLPTLLHAQPSPPPRNGTLRLRAAVFADGGRGGDSGGGGASGGGDSAGSDGGGQLEAWRRLCREGAAVASLPLVFLHGIADAADDDAEAGAFTRGGGGAARGGGRARAPRDALRPLDSAVTPREFRQVLGGKPRWPSTLQPSQLEELTADCPAAQNLSVLRRACAGYFLTVEKRGEGRRAGR